MVCIQDFHCECDHSEHPEEHIVMQKKTCS